ncbi:MAG: 1,6-anhydro-N-acetylmuramyl-L-alanine amidase AmpD [bacterium]
MVIDPTGWFVDVARRPSDNFNERPPGVFPELLVIHNISLPPGEFGGGYVEDFFQNCLDCSIHPYFQEIEELQVSAHLFVARQGAVTQFVSLNDRAWHAGESSYCGRHNCNDFSIGIELEGTDDLPYTEEQYQTLARLTRAMMTQYPTITADRIVGHSDIAPGRKTDPGESFDWPRYHALLDKSEGV